MKFSFDTFDFIEKNEASDKAAIVGIDNTLSWKELEKKVEETIAVFEENGWSNSANPVIVYGHKEVEMIVAMYACMKMGITYIPIDIIYPLDRMQKIVDAASVELMINCSNVRLVLPNVQQAFFQKGEWSIEGGMPIQSMIAEASDSVVYTIFTSGSTGEPKGVQISRSAVQSFQRWMTSDFGFHAEDVFVNIALFSFDLSVFELLTFASLGATLLLNPSSIAENPDLLDERIAQNDGTVLVSTPSFSMKIARIDGPKMAAKLSCFLFCGEVLPNPLAATLKETYPNAKIYNTYGPTEATVATTLVEITPEIITNNPVLPVGFSKRESEILIENDEIIIVGDNVSIGYLNRPDLNETKFFVHEGKRAFRTGDLGYMENGQLYCKGRNDDQVKLHGYRIELNEITAKINEITSVREATTIALKRNEEVKKIVSVVVLKEMNGRDAKEWKKFILEELSHSLPSYMVPSDVKLVDQIPLNQNGKADKKMVEALYLRK